MEIHTIQPNLKDLNFCKYFFIEPFPSIVRNEKNVPAAGPKAENIIKGRLNDSGISFVLISKEQVIKINQVHKNVTIKNLNGNFFSINPPKFLSDRINMIIYLYDFYILIIFVKMSIISKIRIRQFDIKII